jgi:hypothetical protein
MNNRKPPRPTHSTPPGPDAQVVREARDRARVHVVESQDRLALVQRELDEHESRLALMRHRCGHCGECPACEAVYD